MKNDAKKLGKFKSFCIVDCNGLIPIGLSEPFSGGEESPLPTFLLLHC